jgi:hypothetical protein
LEITELTASLQSCPNTNKNLKLVLPNALGLMEVLDYHITNYPEQKPK